MLRLVRNDFFTGLPLDIPHHCHGAPLCCELRQRLFGGACLPRIINLTSLVFVALPQGNSLTVMRLPTPSHQHDLAGLAAMPLLLD